MATQTINDPLGILALQREIGVVRLEISNLEDKLTNNLDLPITEKVLIEKTGIKASTLTALRKAGKIRSYKPGKDVMYIPSEFRQDIRKLL